MAYTGASENLIRPKKGDTTINLPITFDYSGGRKDSRKGKIIWICVLAIISLIIGLGIITSDDGFFIVNIVLGLAFIYIMSLVIRFAILKEHKIRNRLASMQEKDFVEETRSFWGIYSIDDEYPYYAHLRNGKTALYVAFEKDVILGKVAEAEFEHYEAIGDAYNLAGSKKINMCHIDYMDNVGTDDRLVECFKKLPDVKNPDLRDILSDIYSNLQEEMSERVATFDVYVFTFNSSETVFWYNIQQVIGCMLEANYVRPHILNSDDLRDLTKSLFNIHDFSVIDAESSTFEEKQYAGVIPISLVTPDGEEVIFNKTLEEKKEESDLRAKEAEMKKEEKKRRKKKKNKGVDKSDQDEIDIFG